MDPCASLPHVCVWLSAADSVRQFYLSTLVPFLALLTSFYAIFATFFILLSFPFCRCVTNVPLSRHFRSFLLPPLLLHLRLIYSDAEEINQEEGASSASSSTLVVLNVFAPFYAMGIMLAAWVAAGFWFFGAILGDPNGRQEKDKDEQAVVLYVSRWWERWLLRGFR